MGCGASAQSGTQQANEHEQHSLPNSWDELPCKPEAREALRSAGLGLAAASTTIEQLGLEEASDLALIGEEDISRLNLRPIEVKKLRAAVASAKSNGSLVKASDGIRSGSGSSADAPVDGDHVAGGLHERDLPMAEEPDPPKEPKDPGMPLVPPNSKVSEVIKKSLRLGVTVLQEVGPALPFPGGEAASLLATLFQRADTALVCRDNLAVLAERAADLMDIIVEKREAVGAGGLGAYRSVVGRFVDVLRRVQEYSSAFMGKHWVVRLLTATSDAADFEDLAQDLRELTVEAVFAVTADTHTVALDIKDKVDALMADMQARTVYVDHSKQLRELVESLGGVDAVLADPSLQEQALTAMELSQRLSVAMMQQALKVAQAQIEGAMDKGFHRHIRQTDLKLFWRTFFEGWKVPWSLWWSEFPEALCEVHMTPDAVARLKELLASEAAKGAFHDAVERSEPDYISVDELKLSFPPDIDLPTRVSQLVGVAGRAGSSMSVNGSSTVAGGSSAFAAVAAATAAATAGGEVAASGGGFTPHHPPLLTIPSCSSGGEASGATHAFSLSSLFSHSPKKGAAAATSPGAAGSPASGDVAQKGSGGTSSPGGIEAGAPSQKPSAENGQAGRTTPASGAGGVIKSGEDNERLSGGRVLSAGGRNRVNHFERLSHMSGYNSHRPSSRYLGSHVSRKDGSAAMARCRLPELDRLYCGREAIATELVDRIRATVQGNRGSTVSVFSIAGTRSSNGRPATARPGTAGTPAGPVLFRPGSARLTGSASTNGAAFPGGIPGRHVISTSGAASAFSVAAGGPTHVRQRVFLLLGPGGLGKSCLALDVGWRLARQGFVPGGVMLVDMREARTLREITGRVCETLGVVQDAHALSSVRLRLVELIESQGRALLVLDNCEDVLGGPAPVALLQLLASLLDAGEVVLLLTSRAPLDPLLAAASDPTRPPLPLPLPPRGPSRSPSPHRKGQGPTGKHPAKAADRLSAPAAVVTPEQQPAVGGPTTDAAKAAAAVAAWAGKLQAAGGVYTCDVPPVGDDMMRQLVRGVAAGEALSESEVVEVAAACEGVPLVTRLAADALAHGRISLQDLHCALTSAGSISPTRAHALGPQPSAPFASRLSLGSSAPVTPSLRAQSDMLPDAGSEHLLRVGLLLSTLPKPLLQQLVALAVFPSTFDEEGAAAVVGCSLERVPGVLRILYSHSLLLHDSVRGEAYLHMAVRTTLLTDLCDFSEVLSSSLAGAKERYITYFLGLLTEWADMYQSPAFGLAQQLLRGHAANIRHMWKLLQGSDVSLGSIWAVGSAMTAAVLEVLEDVHLLEPSAPVWPHLLAVLEQEQQQGGAPQQGKVAGSCFQVAAAAARNTAAAVNGSTSGPATAAVQGIDATTPAAATAATAGAAGNTSTGGPTGAGEVTGLGAGPRLSHAHLLARLLQAQAACLQVASNHGQAEPLCKRALDLLQSQKSDIPDLEKQLPSGSKTTTQKQHQQQHHHQHQHSQEVLSAMHRHAVCLAKQAKWSEAEPLCLQVLQGRTALLGPDHPDTLTAMGDLAWCLHGADKLPEAETLFSQVLAGREDALGRDHPRTIAALNAHGNCLAKMGQHASAAPLFRRSLELQARSLGPHHPLALASKASMDACLLMSTAKMRALMAGEGAGRGDKVHQGTMMVGW